MPLDPDAPSEERIKESDMESEVESYQEMAEADKGYVKQVGAANVEQ